jgi:uncharacterized protein GlcG (DUF336 family)
MRIHGSVALVAALGAGLIGCQKSGDGGAAASPTPAVATAAKAEAPAEKGSGGCSALPSADDLRKLLREAPDAGGNAGGLFGGRKQWAAVVNRDGELCEVVVSTDDPSAAWPGSRAIAISKAYTANAFSTDDLPLSTARLYTLTQPGHTLWGLANGNPFNPECYAAPGDRRGRGKICGGTIVFGGGVPLYKGNAKVGGLGTSGDTACADHEISKRMRDKAGLNPPGGAAADDITYSKADGASVFTHPLCANTFRNGKKLGDEAKASY